MTPPWARSAPSPSRAEPSTTAESAIRSESVSGALRALPGPALIGVSRFVVGEGRDVDDTGGTTAGGAHVTNGDVIDPTAPPGGWGCVESRATAGWWLHPRRCPRCGHVGCGDSSPPHPAQAPPASSGPPVARSFDPGEDCF